MGIVSGQRGVTLLIQNKAISIDDSSHVIRSMDFEIPVPYVIKLNYYVKTPPLHTTVPFSRRGILVRDNHKCAYCGKPATTIDHIVPKSKGGNNSYENCVASCLKCNGQKSNLTLHESGLVLRHEPYQPSVFTNILFKAMNDDALFASWSSYVFMYQPSLKDSFVRVSSV
jgi:5-methylcytosine-specific restriction endonuclease McrA